MKLRDIIRLLRERGLKFTVGGNSRNTPNTTHCVRAHSAFSKQRSQVHSHAVCFTAAEKYRGSNLWHTGACDVTVGQSFGNLGTRSSKRAQCRGNFVNFWAVARQRGAAGETSQQEVLRARDWRGAAAVLFGRRPLLMAAAVDENTGPDGAPLARRSRDHPGVRKQEPGARHSRPTEHDSPADRTKICGCVQTGPRSAGASRFARIIIPRATVSQ